MKVRNLWLEIATLLMVVLAGSSLLASGCGSDQAAGTGAGTSADLSSRDLYRQALEKSVTEPATDVSSSVDLDSGQLKIHGDIVGPPSGKTNRIQADAQVTSNMQGIPVSMAMGLVGISEQGKEDGYLVIKSVTTSDQAHKQQLESLFAPTLNQWVKMDEKQTPDQPHTFEKEGPLAALDMLDVFDPLGALSTPGDQQLFLTAVDKDNLYDVSDGIEPTQFHGVAARKIRVTVNKQAFKQVDKEVSSGVSTTSDFKASDPSYADVVFGKGDTFSADIYLDANETAIIGVTLTVNVNPPIPETTFNTMVSKVDVSVFIDYNTRKTIEPPSSFITEQELDALMKRGR